MLDLVVIQRSGYTVEAGQGLRNFVISRTHCKSQLRSFHWCNPNHVQYAFKKDHITWRYYFP